MDYYRPGHSNRTSWAETLIFSFQQINFLPRINLGETFEEDQNHSSRANMTDFVTINNARLGYRLCGPDNAPLIITLHGGRGMGTGNVLEPLASAEKANSAQVITDQTSKHLVP